MATSPAEVSLTAESSVASATSSFCSNCTSSCMGTAGAIATGFGIGIGVTWACTCTAGSQFGVSPFDNSGAPIANDGSEFCVLAPMITKVSKLPTPIQTTGSRSADLIGSRRSQLTACWCTLSHDALQRSSVASQLRLNVSADKVNDGFSSPGINSAGTQLGKPGAHTLSRGCTLPRPATRSSSLWVSGPYSLSLCCKYHSQTPLRTAPPPNY